MPDYQETLEYANFWRENVVPYLRNLIDRPTNFSEYIFAFYNYRTQNNTFGFASPYIYSLNWLKRFQKKCVTFQHNAPSEIAQGAPPISAIYQLKPTLHCMANISTWRESGENDGHITCYFVYENFKKMMGFIEDNLDLVKQKKKEKVGFALSNGVSLT